MTFKEYWNYEKADKPKKLKQTYSALALAALICAMFGAMTFLLEGQSGSVRVEILNPLPSLSLLIGGSLMYLTAWGSYPLFGRWVDRKFAE